MDNRTEKERRYSMEQALASSRISGHVPTPEFLADCERVVRGEMTNEELRAVSLARAVATDRAATGRDPSEHDAQSPDNNDGQLEPCFITEQIEAEMRAAGYTFEPPLCIRLSS